MDIPVTLENFDEDAYLAANPDVKAAVLEQVCVSGRAHFEQTGWREGRNIRAHSGLAEMRRSKMQLVRPFLRHDMQSTVDIGSGDKLNYLTNALREETRIIDTDNISAYPYDEYILSLLKEFDDGIILDCGAGRRPVYYNNIINYEIVDYDTTDVLGVGEHLPFFDNTFDAVISLAVLEHVRDPMRCANEIARVLKPFGKLLCAMPFLQPLHGYPHHYFNATQQGLRRLFEDNLQIEKESVPYGLHPTFALQWIIQSWANGLSGDAKEQFLDARMSDFMVNPVSLMDRLFVTQLPQAQQVELACGNMIEARKPA
jgi:SAM-dependent methyltransferase